MWQLVFAKILFIMTHAHAHTKQWTIDSNFILQKYGAAKTLTPWIYNSKSKKWLSIRFNNANTWKRLKQ